MKKESLFRIGFTVVTVLFIFFIFFNSMQPAAVSDQNSSYVLKLVQTMFSTLGIQTAVTEHLIRKTAHFLEYLVLGALLISTLRCYWSSFKSYLFPTLFFGLLIPVIDETIQLFSLGRSGQVSDILLDFCGVLAGIFLLFFLMIKQIKKLENRTGDHDEPNTES